MIERIFDIALRTMFILTACAGIWHYVSFVTPRVVDYAVPVRDGSEFRVVKKMTTKIGETFKSFSSETIVKPFDYEWPCFRGARRDNLVQEDRPLTKTWGAEGPKVMWRKELGEGYSGAIIAQGRVYLLDYLEKEDSDALRCFELLTGNELWQRSYKNPIRRNHGKSRTIPAYADNVVVTLGPAAHVMATDATNGDLLWSCDLVETYGCEIPQWYAGQCPLIENGKVILGVGGEKVLMTALDLKTGKTLWETPNPDKLKMSHSSVVSSQLCGIEQFVYAGIGGITACDHNGKPLWTCKNWKPAVWAPTPLKIADDLLFLTAGYGAGSALLRVRLMNGVFEATIENEWKPTKGPASEQQTPLLIDKTLFVIQPKDAGGLHAQLVAADVDKLPALRATSGKEARFGLGPYLYANGAFWIMDDDGFLHVYQFKDDTFQKLAAYKVVPGVDAWGPIAYAGGLMILRDSTSMACLDLRKEDAK